MIAIINDLGESLQLDPEQSLVTEQAGSWTSDDELPGEYSYPIEAPLSEANKRFVMHGYRPDRAQPRYQMVVNVQMEGVLYRRCTFAYRVAEGKLSGYLKIDASEFYDTIRKMSLLEALSEPVLLGDGLVSTPPVSFQTRLKQIAQLSPGQFPCTFFPIRDDIFLEEEFVMAPRVTTVFLPGVNIGIPISSDSGFVRNNYVNAWEKLADGSLGFAIDLPNMPRYGNLICPQFYLAWVLETILAKFGYRIESDWLASPDVQCITIKNLTAMKQLIGTLGEVFSGHVLTPGLFLPDMSVGDFLLAVKSRFGLQFSYQSTDKVCYIAQFTQAIAQGAAIDLTPFQTGLYSTDFPAGKGFTVSDYIDAGDELYRDTAGNSIKLPTQVIGAGETQISLKAGTCQLVRETSPLGAGARWFVPKVRQAGNVLDSVYKKSSRYLTSEGKRPNAVGLCFLSYRGMTQDSAGNPYPLGTPGVLDGQQLTVGAQALTLSGLRGAWRSYLRAYFYFRDQTQRITQPLLLPASVLSGLQLHRSVALSLEDHVRRSYLISKLQAEAPGLDGKVYCRLEVLSLPSGLDQSTDADAPLIWVELVQVNTAQQAIGNTNVSGYEVYASLTFRAWTSSAKTTPAPVTNLALQLRRTQKGKFTLQDIVSAADTGYSESVEYFTLTSAEVIWETRLLVQTKLVNHVRDITLLDYSLSYQLDPGEGYAIL